MKLRITISSVIHNIMMGNLFCDDGKSAVDDEEPVKDPFNKEPIDDIENVKEDELLSEDIYAVSSRKK